MRGWLVIPVVLVALVGPAIANDLDLTEACQGRGEYCYGRVVRACSAELGKPKIIPAACFEREQAVWQVLLDRTYAQVLAETFAKDKSVTELVRAEHAAWQTYRDLHCKVQDASNPHLNGTIMARCLANMTFERTIEVSYQVGADWIIE
jgi:uncharacterized protein YecT (DUF1311 family)